MGPKNTPSVSPNAEEDAGGRGERPAEGERQGDGVVGREAAESTFGAKLLSQWVAVRDEIGVKLPLACG